MPNNLIDFAFTADALSLSDKFLIAGGDVSPIIASIAAPKGSLYLTSGGTIFVKTDVLDTDWTEFPLIDAKVKTDISDPTSGYLSDKLSSTTLALSVISEKVNLELNASGVSPGTYTKVAVDTYGRVTTGYNPTTLGGFGITDAQPLNVNLTSLANNLTPGIQVLTATGNITSRLLSSTTLNINNAGGVLGNPVIDLSTTGVSAGTYDKVTVDVYGRVTSATNLTSSDLVTILGYTPVNKAGDTMTGDLILNRDPVVAMGAVTRQYVDNLAQGVLWRAPIIDPNLVGITSTEPVSPALLASYIAYGGTYPQVWTGGVTVNSLDVVSVISAGVWAVIRTLTSGDRIGIGFESPNLDSTITSITISGHSLVKNDLIAYQGGNPTLGTSWTLPEGFIGSSILNNITVTCNNPLSESAGHTYTYNLQFNEWIEISGPAMLKLGNGLILDGVNIAVNPTSRFTFSNGKLELASVGTPGSYNNVTTDAYGRVTSGSTIAYLTGNQAITLSGDITGLGTTSIATTLKNTGTAGTYTKVTTDAQGRVTVGTTLSASDIPSLPWSIITSGTPTTLSGYGITDAVKNISGAPSIQENIDSLKPVAGTLGRLYYSTDLKAWYRDNGTTWDLIQPALTGDITLSAGSTNTTLSNTGVTPGTYNNLTTDAKGRITSASNITYLTANQSITISNDATGSGTTSISLTLATVNNNIGSFGTSTSVPQITVNAKGLVTAAGNVSIAFPVTSVNTRTGAITLTNTDVGLGNVANSLQVINAGGTPSMQEGLLSARPSAGTSGRLYIATDTASTFRDNGSSWDLLHPAITGDITIPIGTTASTLKNTGTAGTYTKVTTDAQGRVTVGAQLASSDITTALGYTPVNKAGDTMTGQLVLSADPTVALGAATKQYVDNLALGLDFKNSVRAGTTGPITLSGTQTIDTVVLVAGNRVLVKNQATASTNGIYDVASGPWTRSSDAAVSSEVTTGMYTYIEEGGQKGQGWVLSTVMPIVLGTTALTFTQFNAAASSFTVGGGLTYASNILSVATASSSRIVINANSIDLATTGVAAGSYNNVTVDLYGRVTAGSNVAYISGVTLSGDVTGSGTSNITTTLANSGVTPGSNYNNFTVNAKGIVTSASTIAYLTANQTITISGDATGSGTTSIPLTLNTVTIAKGGTGQTTALAAFNALSPLTTKGDIHGHDTTNNIRIPVGADGYGLIADSTQAAGVKWSPTNVPGSGRILQILFAPIPSISGTTTMSSGSTPPLVTEGTELWNQVVTIQSILGSRIKVNSSLVIFGSTNNMEMGVAVFRNSVCIGAIEQTTANVGAGSATSFTFYDNPGLSGTYTYSCRIGKFSGNGTWYVNQHPTPKWGTLMAQNAYTVEEIYIG